MAQLKTHAHAVMEAIEIGYTYALPASETFTDNLLKGLIGCDKNPLMIEAPHRPVAVYHITENTQRRNVFGFTDGSQLSIGDELSAFASGEVGSLDAVDKAKARLEESQQDLHVFNVAVTSRDHATCNSVKEHYQMLGGSNANTFTEIKARISSRQQDLASALERVQSCSVEELAQTLFITARRMRSDVNDVKVNNNPDHRRALTQKIMAECNRIHPHASNAQWKEAASYLNKQQEA